ncbi:MAG: 3-keto-disaccharide hydrolase [Bacteroidota bacterium]
MKKTGSTLIVFASLIILAIASSCKSGNNNMQENSNATSDTVFLFNGNDLSGLEVYIEDTSYNKDEVWSVRNNLLYTTGMPFGYIRTTDSYDNYDLFVEWRWVEEPKNSGVLLHMQQPDTLWPATIEAQLMHTNAGDFVAMGGTSFKELTDTTTIVVPKYEDTSEKEAGQWNTYKISVEDSTITLWVNDVLQNKATETSVTEGMIGLQSEGGPMEFRNFYLIPKNN